jgi:hypothetical protein
MTSAFFNSPRISERVISLNGERYLLAHPQEGGRDWQEQTVPAQEADPLVEFSLPVGDCSEGAGFSFEGPPGTYDWADRWDATTPGKPITWPLLVTGETFETEDFGGWLRFHEGYLYLLRGSYAVKYEHSDTPGAVMPILEVKYFGTGDVVAGRPERYKGLLYVPLKDSASDANERFMQLTTVVNSVAEVQTIIISGTPTGGTYTVSWQGFTTTALVFNASGATLQAALRLLPGLELVTVVTTGTTPNFTHTITMTGASGATGSASAAPMTSTDSTTGGAHAIAHNTTTAGVNDTWTQGPATREFRCFRRFTSNKMYAADQNLIYAVSDDPMVSGDWAPADGSGYEVGDSDSPITDLVIYSNFLGVCKTDGFWTFEEDLTTLNRLPDLELAPDPRNGVGAEYSNAYVLIPNKAGFIRWRPGAYRFVGPEMEGALEGELSRGWGRVSGIATYGPTAYYGVTNALDQSAALASLQPPRRERGPVVPHVHHEESPASYEGLTLVQVAAQPVEALTPTTFSDDSAVGTIAWGNTGAASVNDGTDATAAAGISHYLKALNPGPSLPAGATVTGIKVAIDKATSNTSGVTPPAFRSDSLQNFSGKNWDVTPPSAAAATDALLAYVITADENAIPSEVPNGWELLSVGGGGFTQEHGHRLYGKAAGTIPTDWRWRFSSAKSGSVYIAAFTGGDQVTPWATGSDGGEKDIGGIVNAVLPASDCPENSCLHIILTSGAFDTGFTVTPPSGYTEHEDADLSGVAGGHIHVCSDNQNDGTVAAKTMVSSLVWGISVVTLGVFLRPERDVVDSVVRLVKAGTVVGDNKAATTAADYWPFSDEVKEYGGSSDLWGTTWTPAEVEAATFGVVISADTGTNWTARVDHIEMTVYYTVSGNAELNSYVAVLHVAEDRATCRPQLYALPHAGLTIANDPTVEKATSDATLYHSRRWAPQRGVEKVYRVYETWVELDPEASDDLTIPGFQIWADVDGRGAYQLTDEDGAAKTAMTTGFHQFWFPVTEAAVGHYCQIQWRVPSLDVGEVATAVTPREGVLKGSYRPLTTQLIETNLVLSGGEHEDGTSMRRTAREQLAALEAIAGPNAAAVPFRDVVGRDRHAVVVGLAWKEQQFRNEEEASYAVQLRMRCTPYD